ncbi:hypothetical protein HK100_001681, partial [Physocladia obscura]
SKQSQKEDNSSTTLCILAIPSHWAAQDLLRYIASYTASISHIRFLRDSQLSRAIVLVRFRTGRAYDGEPAAFFAEFNNSRFDSLQGDDSGGVCRVVWVADVVFSARLIDVPQFVFAQSVSGDVNSIFSVGGAALAMTRGSGNGSEVGSPQGASSSTATSPLIELPTCPVCLDRMDASVTGLVTIFLSKWQDASCPVCRYSSNPTTHYLRNHQNNTRNQQTYRAITPLLSDQSHARTFPTENQTDDELHANQTDSALGNDSGSNHPEINDSNSNHGNSISPNTCTACKTTQNLWICLICGNVGCGRYQRAHAAKHYADTLHLYALELETQRVWDYAGDGYVHRLIRSAGVDGKVVELIGGDDDDGDDDDGRRRRRRRRRQQGKDGKGKVNDGMKKKSGKHFGDYSEDDGRRWDDDSDSEADAIEFEYSMLLSSQLESQRRWYEEQIDTFAVESTSKLDAVMQKLAFAETEKAQLEAECNAAISSAAAERKKLEDGFQKEREKMDRKHEKIFERLAALEKTFSEERSVNNSLRQNQEVFKSQIEAKAIELADKNKQIDELSEQVRDLMFYLETQQVSFLNILKYANNLIEQKVNESPIKSELQNGTVVIEQHEVVNPANESVKSGKSKSKKKK